MSWTRRDFLKTIGLGAAALPLLPHMDAFAQAGGAPKRLLIFFTPHGFDREEWKGTAGADGTIEQVGPVLQNVAGFRDRMVMFSGIDNPAAHNTPNVRNLRPHPHVKNMASFLTGEVVVDGNNTGMPSAISVDQVIARQIGADSRFESLQFAVHPGGDSLASGDDGVLIHAETDPVRHFDRLFAGIGDDPVMTGPDPGLVRRRNVADFIGRRMQKFESKVSTEDRYKIEHHIASVQKLEEELATLAENAPSVATCEPVAPEGGLDPGSDGDVPALLKANIDLLTMAFKCDLTRVATFQIGNHNGNINHSYLEGASAENEHRYRHTKGDALRAIGDFYHEHFNMLLTELDGVPEGDGTMLDNTLVVYISPDGHNFDDNNVAFFGGAGGVIETNRFHEFDGATTNDLMLTICEIMGVSLPTFGNPDWSNGVLSGIV